MKKLEGKELYRRLQEARNTKKLLGRMVQRVEALEQLIEVMKESARQKDELIVLQKELIQKQALRIEALEKMVFGKSKGKRREKDDEDDSGSSQKPPQGKPRAKESYQRAIPNPDEITETTMYALPCCPDCKGELTKKKVVGRFVEDIVLPEDTKNPLKRVEKQLIESGWCAQCKSQKSLKPINGSRVVLGENTKLMIVYLSIVMRMSYQQICNLFRDIWWLKLSDGEIRSSLEEQGNRLTGEHEAIARSLLNQAAHYDETGWKTNKGAAGNYAWIQTGTSSTDTLFLLGKSRGKGNAKALVGASGQVGITDDYPGYDGVFSRQALCWAHPLRKLRDLAQSQTLSGESKTNCQTTFEGFKRLYRDLDEFKGSFEERKSKKAHYVNRFRAIAAEEADDPTLLKTYKKTLRKEERKYFTCIDVEAIPMDNNQAERRLRHLVLKRKISFGSKTEKGALIMEKLFSVVLTWWWRDPSHFISNYRHLLA